MVRDAMTLERFSAMVEAYGARPERWPEAERAAALGLLERSPEAAAVRAAAARLDGLLDHVPTAAPSDALVARVLAGAPAQTARRRPAGRHGAARRSRARLVAAAAVTFAAAASVALWLAREGPEPQALAPEVVAQLGVYDVPTDALLSVTDAGLIDASPSVGCDDPVMDCEEQTAEDARRSRAEPPGAREMQA
jgi:hypothetical protein